MDGGDADAVAASAENARDDAIITLSVLMVAAASPATALPSCALESEAIESITAVSAAPSAPALVGASVGDQLASSQRRRRRRPLVGAAVGAYVAFADALLESRPLLSRLLSVLPTVSSVPLASPTLDEPSAMLPMSASVVHSPPPLSCDGSDASDESDDAC